MDKMEAAKAYFASMPKVTRQNPFWEFDETSETIKNHQMDEPFSIERCERALSLVRDYFRNVFNSFGTEAQVLLLYPTDAEKLHGIRTLGETVFHGIPATIMVLPQWNTPGNSMISESMYHKWIREPQITPIARIHSHHRLDAYQSATDYNTLNSGTLELVLGHIQEKPFQVAYWLDTPGTETKQFVWQAQWDGSDYEIRRIASGSMD